MQVFEFHFNPKLKPDLIFDSFCFEPEDIYEKRVGSLYIIGLLKNALPPNVRFLDNLAKVIKERYYRLTVKSPEKALKESLKEANEFLDGIAKRGDVSWLGNLSLAILSLKNFELNFTKVGETKIFLLRGGQIIDIDKNLKLQDIEPYPLKVFGNIVSGKLAEDDLILVLTKEAADFFANENLLEKIARIRPFSEEKLKEVFRPENEKLERISGICLLLFLSKEALAGKKEMISPRARLKKFSFKEVFSPAIKLLPAAKIELKLPQKLEETKTRIKPVLRKKNLISVLLLISVLTLGFFISQLEKGRQLEIYKAKLEEIQEKVDRAESFLILKETSPELKNQANSLLKESWREISLLEDFNNQVSSLKDRIADNLYELNKLKIIEEPELIFEFSKEEFAPRKLAIFEKNLYFFSPYAPNLFKLNQDNQGQIISIDRKFNLAVRLTDSVLFFSKPNRLTILKNGGLFETSLEEPFPEPSFTQLATYNSNLYFLDRSRGEIIKYPYLENFSWGQPQLWLARETEKATDLKSMAVDGSVWILNKDSSISRYYFGRIQETFSLEFFPEPKDISKIFTSSRLPYLYLLEPSQNRVIVLDRSGRLVSQFQSPKFDNLLDFSVSSDGKIIWLLNSLKVYQVNLKND